MLKSNGKIISESTDEKIVTTTAKDNYLYVVDFNLNKSATKKNIDIDNLTIDFTYEVSTSLLTNTISNSTTNIKLVSSNLGDSIDIKFDDGEVSSTLIIVIEVLATVILLILLLLILFLILRQRKNKLEKQTGVQDGFLEYNTEHSFDDLYNESQENYDYYEDAEE